MLPFWHYYNGRDAGKEIMSIVRFVKLIHFHLFVQLKPVLSIGSLLYTGCSLIVCQSQLSQSIHPSILSSRLWLHDLVVANWPLVWFCVSYFITCLALSGKKFSKRIALVVQRTFIGPYASQSRLCGKSRRPHLNLNLHVHLHRHSHRSQPYLEQRPPSLTYGMKMTTKMKTKSHKQTLDLN